MFGQPSTSPFGAPAPAATPFGSSANTTPAFGAAPPAAPFGSAGGFGAPPAAPAFGAPAPSTGFGGGGGFGSAAPPAPGAFGAPPAPGAFGAPAAPGGFGAPAPAPLFGSSATTPPSTSPFGAPAPAPGGIFGAPAPAPTGGLFGSSPTPAPGGFGAAPAPAFGGFGSTTTTSAFGAPAPATSAFGAPAPAPGGIFGAPAPSAFGGGASAFGSPAPAPSGGLFGAAPATTTPPGGSMFGGTPGGAQAAGGTKIVPYAVTPRTDGSTNITLQSISAMPQYERKSFEELRFEDYQQGNKGDMSGTSGGFGGFGAPAPATTGFGAPAPAPGGLFGGSPAPAPFGAPAPAFGPPAPAPFGAPAPGGFGSPAPAPGAFGGFGAPAPAAPGGFGGFGGAKAPAPSGGLFGAPAPAPAGGGLFGAPAPAPATGGLFGSTPAPAPAFGAPAPAPGSLFGSPAPAPAFGAPAPAPGGLFGAPAPTPAGGGLFGTTPAPAPGSLFGQAPAPAFGAPAPTPGGLFGAPAPAPGFFGAPAPAPVGMFGAPAPAPGGLFGARPPAPAGGMFGAPAPGAPALIGTPGSTASVIPPAADAVLAQQLAALDNQRKEMQTYDVWRGGSPQTSSIVPTSLSETEATLTVSPYSASPGITSYKASPKSAAKIRPRGFGTPSQSNNTAAVLSQLGKGTPPLTSPALSSSAKRLVIKPGAHTPKPSLRLRLPASGQSETEPDSVLRLSTTAASPQVNGEGPSSAKLPAPATHMRSPAVQSPQAGQEPPRETPPAGATPRNSASAQDRAGYDSYMKVIGSPQGKAKVTNGNLVPKLTREGYTVSPSLDVLANMSEADLATVSGFTVTRAGYGRIAWDGDVDVRGVDLDAIVNIGFRDVAVYDEQEAAGTKPPAGSKLNRPAVITIVKLFPKEGEDADEEQKKKFARKIEKSTAKMGAELISFDPNTGEWKFRVQHFSRYGFVDDDSEDEDEVQPPKKARVGKSPPGGVLSQSEDQDIVSPTRFTIPDREDVEMDTEDDDEGVLVSDTETNDAAVRESANQAYEALFSPQIVETRQEQRVEELVEKEVEQEFFPDETIDQPASAPLPVPPSEESLRVGPSVGLSEKISQRKGVRPFTSSSTDFGMRFGRSCRIGWRPDGSLLHCSRGGVLAQARPVFAEGSTPSALLLEAHHKYAKKNVVSPSGCPSFALPDLRDGSKDLHKVAVAFEEAYKTAMNGESGIVIQAFSLLACLLGHSSASTENALLLPNAIQADGNVSLRTRSGTEAFRRWLKKACSQDISQEIEILKGGPLQAVFVALTAGDLELASSIASEIGHDRLAAVVSLGSTAAEYLQEQIYSWNEAGSERLIPGDLLRIYTLLSGDLGTEEQVFKGGDKSIDWMRRVAMLLVFGWTEDDDNYDLTSLVEKYEAEVVTKTAPFPQSQFSNEVGVECLLYRIIRLGDAILKGLHSSSVSIAHVIAPNGHVESVHNVAAAFHLAAILSSTGCCDQLSREDKAWLYDTYSAQLIAEGRWDLAVYVMLCSLGDGSSHWQIEKAKSIVLQNYMSGMDKKRVFLTESIGVPARWFAEALAVRAANSGNSFECAKLMAEYSPEKARETLEEAVVPTLLFRNAKDTEKCLQLLASFVTDDKSLVSAVVDFFQLSKDVISVSVAPTEERSDLIDTMLKTAADLERRFAHHKAQAENGSLSTPYHPVVSMQSFLGEAQSEVAFLKLQLEALKAGSSIWEEEGVDIPIPMKLASQLLSSITGADETSAPDMSTVVQSSLTGLV